MNGKPATADNTIPEKPVPSPAPVTEQKTEQKSEESRKRIPLASIPATISIGLLIAALYLGGRIFTAHRVQKPAPAFHSATPAAPPVAAPAEAKAIPQPAPSAAQPVSPVEAKAIPQPAPSAAQPVSPVEAKAVPQPAPSAAQPVSPPGQAATPAPQAAIPTPPALGPQPASAVTPAGDSGDDTLPMIQPRSGERYLQVGALDPDAQDTRRFVERLRGEGLDPHVAQGPTPVLMRVLIGPFTRPDALNEKKAQIESEGIDTFVREY